MTDPTLYAHTPGWLDAPANTRIEPSLDARPSRRARLYRKAVNACLICVGLAWSACVAIGSLIDNAIGRLRRFEDAIESIDDPQPYLAKMERFSARVFVIAAMLLFMLVAFCIALLAIERVAARF